MLTKEMQAALEADGEKLRQLTGQDHGPYFTNAEVLFTCLKCEAHYSVNHLPQPVTECPVCGWH